MAWGYHAAVLEPVSGSLWAIGGMVRRFESPIQTLKERVRWMYLSIEIEVEFQSQLINPSW